MLELILAGSAVVAAGAGVATGLFIGRRSVRVKWPLVDGSATSSNTSYTSLSLSGGHTHVWHIGGKDNGSIRRECECGEVKHGG